MQEIEFRHGLIYSPQVIRMTAILRSNPSFVAWSGATCEPLVRHALVTFLAGIWMHADDFETGNFLLEHCTLNTIDLMSGVPGLGEAMAAVGAAEEEENAGVIISLAGLVRRPR